MPNKSCLTELQLTSIYNDGIDSIPISREPKRVRDAYVAMQDLTPDEIATVEDPTEYSLWMESTMNPFIMHPSSRTGFELLLSKRWRVS